MKMAALWAILYGVGLFGSLIHPFYPFFSYILFYYLPPHLNWWGQYLPDLRYSLIASVFLLVSVAMLQSTLEKVKEQRNSALIWLVAFAANAVLVTAWALQPARSWIYTVMVLKLVVLYALMPAAIRTPAYFDAFGAVHIVGASYWGYKAWDNPKRKAGRLMEVGGPDTQNDNQAAGHLLTVLPFVALYALTEKRLARRLGLAVAGAFVLNVFILCNSRGATLGLIASGLAAIVLAGKGRRKRLIGVAIVGTLATLYLADPEYIARQQTTVDANDGAAESRKAMWAAGLRMINDHPLGGGGRTFHILSPRYIPEVLAATDSEERSPHNTYIQLATDWGLQGTALFSVFMFMSLRMLHQVRRRTPQNNWYFYRSLTVEVAIIGTMGAAFFSNRLYGESIYWMCSLAFALHRIQSTELEKLESSWSTETVEAAPAALPVGMVARSRA